MSHDVSPSQLSPLRSRFLDPKKCLSSLQLHRVRPNELVLMPSLFLMLLGSQESCPFSFQGVMHQAASPSHLSTTTWATLLTLLPVTETQAILQMCLEGEQFVWDCLCFFVSKKRLMISYCFSVQKQPAPSIREGLTSSVIGLDSTPTKVG